MKRAVEPQTIGQCVLTALVVVAMQRRVRIGDMNVMPDACHLNVKRARHVGRQPADAHEVRRQAKIDSSRERRPSGRKIDVAFERHGKMQAGIEHHAHAAGVTNVDVTRQIEAQRQRIEPLGLERQPAAIEVGHRENLPAIGRSAQGRQTVLAQDVLVKHLEKPVARKLMNR